MLFWVLACLNPVDPAAHQDGEKGDSVVGGDSLDSGVSADSDEGKESGGGETGESGSAGEAAVEVEIDGATPDLPPLPLFHFEGPVPTNVLIITVDTTRRDQMGFFSGYDTTPFWDSILEESVVMMDHRSCSCWTSPSMTCAASGLYPPNYGWWPNTGDGGVPGLPSVLPTIALHMLEQGYQTHLVTSNSYFSTLDNGVGTGFEKVSFPLWQSGDRVTNSAIDAYKQIKANPDQPFLLHVHYFDPHGSYEPPDAYAYELEILKATRPLAWDFTNPTSLNQAIRFRDTAPPEVQSLIDEYLLAVYRGEYRYFDAHLEKLWNTLEGMGALDDTLVVFWTDHGEQFFEHGGYQHGVSLHSQENRTMAAFWAKNLRPNRWEGRTIHYDIAPTIYNIMGMTPMVPLDGLPMGTAPADRTLFTFNYLLSYTSPIVTAIKGDYQLYYGFDGSRYFYDLASDPAGDINIYDPKDPAVRSMWSELKPHLDMLTTNWSHLVPVNPGP